MQAYIKTILSATLFSVALASCSKFLDREPLSQISPDKAFNTENELDLYANSFYDGIMPGSSGNDQTSTFPFYGLTGENADNIVLNSLPSELTGNRIIPVSGGGWSWEQLRNVNYFINNCRNGNVDAAIVNKYVGAARFFRAYFYFYMVTRFGDVPWYADVIAPDDDKALTKPRDSRVLIIDSVLNDINYAISNLDASKSSVNKVNKWTALALKSRICLFEGTFRKYHTELALPGSSELLTQAADAALQLINGAQYNLHAGSSPQSAYQELFTTASANNSEYILARSFLSQANIYYSVNYYTISPSFGKPGLEKGLVNSYLMKDGSRFTEKQGYDTLAFYSETENRDPRLSQTIRTPGYKRIGSSAKLTPSFTSTCTGYQLTKFVTDESQDKLNGNANPLPIFRLGEVLLNYAEAKAELGTLTQADLDLSVNRLRTRVSMPSLNLADANSHIDPVLAAQYTHVNNENKGVILEIRRERRIELVMEGFRWNDLMRWKEGHLLVNQFKGMYFKGPGVYDLDRDGTADLVIYSGTRPPVNGAQYLELGVDVNLENGSTGGAITVLPSIKKTFNEGRDYLFPLPTQELLLNKQLKQNPNW